MLTKEQVLATTTFGKRIAKEEGDAIEMIKVPPSDDAAVYWPERFHAAAIPRGSSS